MAERTWVLWLGLLGVSIAILIMSGSIWRVGFPLPIRLPQLFAEDPRQMVVLAVRFLHDEIFR